MPDKHPNTHRHGGPGASHENADQPAPPDDRRSDADQPWAGESRSRVSSGGGELDSNHTHDPKTKN